MVDRKFNAKLARVRRRTAATMWAEYVALARMWARVPNGSGRVAWALDGARLCRAHLMGGR